MGWRKPKIQDTQVNDVVFTSMDQCSGVTGCKMSALKKWKKAGCPAFTTGGRVHLVPLFKWMNETSGEAGDEDFAPKLMEERYKHARINRLAADRKLMLMKDVVKCISTNNAILFGALDRQDRSELPNDLFGLDRAGIEKVLVAKHLELKHEYKAKIEAHFSAPESADEKEENED